MKEKIKWILPKLEVVLAIVLFFLMLIACGMYIDVKMNGVGSYLPSLPEKEKAMLLVQNTQNSVEYYDDLIEPTFIGIKSEQGSFAVMPGSNTRRTVESSLYSSVFSLFSGKNENLTFESERAKKDYISELKDMPRYVLLSFSSDIPSSAFLPCLSKSYGAKSGLGNFSVKHMFLLEDENLNVYGVCVSSDDSVVKLEPVEITFNSIFSYSYDIQDGYVPFEYYDDGINPVITSTFEAYLCKVLPYASLYGKEQDTEWVSNTLEVFGVNKSLVKSFSNGDKTEINYVDELCEVLIKNDGTVSFKETDSVGLNLWEFLGYYPEDGNNYTFNDKIFAVKNIINEQYYGNGAVSFSIAGIDYRQKDATLFVYLKTMMDGIFVTKEGYDAVFEIQGNNLVFATFPAVSCVFEEQSINVIPQKYAVSLTENNNECFAVLSDSEDVKGYKKLEWAEYSPEVAD